VFVLTLLLPRDVSVAGNLEVADYNTGSDEELVETAVVAAAGLVMIEAINAERAVWVKPIFHRRAYCITTKQPSDDLLPPAYRRSQEYEY
jgi:hypothetical protein